MYLSEEESVVQDSLSSNGHGPSVSKLRDVVGLMSGEGGAQNTSA
jgi:hypothetical protein